MKSTSHLLVSLLLLSALARAAEWPSEAKIEAILEERIETSKSAAVIVVGAVDERGSKVIGYGTTDPKTPRRPDGDTVFEIGSATKAFTAILLAEIVERGEMKLDDPVAKYLPPSVRVPSRDGKQITLLDLATHTSALPRLPDNLKPKDPNNPYADYTVGQMHAFLSGCTLARDIGAKYEYSNLGMGLLGHAIALKAGKSYEALVVERICEPLAMASTRIALTPQLKARLVAGRTEAGAPATNWDIPTLAGAGALRSTANDLVKFIAANLALPPSKLSALMQKTHEIRIPAAQPGLDIALAWHVSPLSDAKMTWHNGGTGGYHSFIGLDTKNRRGVVVLANSAASIDDIGIHLLDTRIALATPKPKTAHQAVEIDRAIFDLYAGEYEFVPGIVLTVHRQGDRFFVRLTGQQDLEVFPKSKTEFFCTAVDAQLTFATSADGKATAVTLHQNGRDQRAKRIK